MLSDLVLIASTEFITVATSTCRSQQTFSVTCLSAVCPGCVKTFLAAETAKKRVENRTHT